MALTSEYILTRVMRELLKFGLKYEDKLERDVSRKSIMKPAKTRLLGLVQDSEEVARITSVSRKRLEIMVFNKREIDNITSVAEQIKDRLGVDYKILKVY
ncbi:hypothetical protein J4449_00835 [Candidatus Woesearchaeota archaeon]|nr:hypothetical protein [Candidatus Woesearchaeota archaeon]